MMYARRTCIFASLIILLLLLSACGGNKSNLESGSEPEQVPVQEVTIKVPKSSEYMNGRLYTEIYSLLDEAGFKNITLAAVEDISSADEIEDGSVMEVSIGEATEFKAKEKFTSGAPVVITYHWIPKLTVSAVLDNPDSVFFFDAGELLFNAGFCNVYTEELFDLENSTDSGNFKTEIIANGKPVLVNEEIPYDSEMLAKGHFPGMRYPVNVVIDFESNWIFSRYDVKAYLDNELLDTMKHGEDRTFSFSLPSGTYELRFENDEDSSVYGSVQFSIDGPSEITYHIECESREVETKKLGEGNPLRDTELIMPCTRYSFLRLSAVEAEAKLKEIGFTNVTFTPSTDAVWNASAPNTVVGISINGKEDFTAGEVLKKSAAVELFFHVPDFQLRQGNTEVTENSLFDLDYILAPGDCLEDVVFTVDEPAVVHWNKDATFEALAPGTAVISAQYGDFIYGQCQVVVNEIRRPIEAIALESEELTVSVGSSFALPYTYEPSNANDTDVKITVSNGLLSVSEDGRFHAVGAGDTEVSYIQDERILAVCKVHSREVPVTEIEIQEQTDAALIGRTSIIRFNRYPQDATNWGLEVSSSDSDVIQVEFDADGAPEIRVLGQSAGTADVIITLSDGTEYVTSVTVEKVVPTQLTVEMVDAPERLEVGGTFCMDVHMVPEDVTVQTVTWQIKDRSLLGINDDGSFSALAVGTTEVTAVHESGLTETFQITVEPTLVKTVMLTSDWESSEPFRMRDHMKISAKIMPENATDQTLTWSSTNEEVAYVTEDGEVIGRGPGTALIKATSPDGPAGNLIVNVLPAPQSFRVTWSAWMVSNDHVGSNWSRSFVINGDEYYSGSYITLMPDEKFNLRLVIIENDSNPDSGAVHDSLILTADICTNGYHREGILSVQENSGRYSGHYAEWEYEIDMVPVD